MSLCVRAVYRSKWQIRYLYQYKMIDIRYIIWYLRFLLKMNEITHLQTSHGWVRRTFNFMRLSEMNSSIGYESAFTYADLLHSLQIMSAQNKFKLYFWRRHFKYIPEKWIDRIHTNEVYMYGAQLIVGMFTSHALLWKPLF